MLSPREPARKLTPRELEVLALLARHTDREIGSELGISPKTVGTHLQNVFRKLGCRNRTEAALAYFRMMIGAQ